MKQTLAFLAALLSPGLASAALAPCTISGAGAGGELTSTTVVTCGGLMFDNFQVLNATGGATGLVDVLANSSYDTVTGAAYLQINPNLTANQDEQLLYQVWGGITQIDMSVSGQSATLTERACANPIAATGSLAFLCTDPTGTTTVSPLGQIIVSSGTPNQPVFSSPFNGTSPVYVFQDVQTGGGGQLTQFTLSFEMEPLVTLSIVPGTGSPGTNLSINGAGFSPGETVNIYAGGVASPLHIVTADASGAFSLTTSERQAPNGVTSVQAVGQSSGKTGVFLFQVTARMAMNPNTGAAGSTTLVQGLGFSAGEAVKIYWNNPRQLLGTATANNRGSFLAGSALTITIPTSAPLGANAVYGVGQTTKAIGKGWITVQ